MMKLKSIIKKSMAVCFMLLFFVTSFCFTGKAAIENKMEKTTLKDNNIYTWQVHHNALPESGVRFVFTDALCWKSSNDFYKDIEKKFRVPSSLPILNFDCVADRLRILTWIKSQRPIVWLIKGLTEYKDSDDKDFVIDIIDVLKNYVVPFWEGRSGTHSCVDLGPFSLSPRSFNIYYT